MSPGKDEEEGEEIAHHRGEDEVEEGQEDHEVEAVHLGDVLVADHNTHHRQNIPNYSGNDNQVHDSSDGEGDRS